MDRLPVPEENIMHRFYADPEKSGDNLFILTPEDTFHALKVLRLRPGDQAEVILNGKRFLAGIERISAECAELVPQEVLPDTEPRLSVTLFQGLPKSDKMDWIVQKAVELGVSRIVPVVFSRCVVRLNVKDSEKKQDRWQKIAREAGKQSGRCRIPAVSLPVPFSGLPEQLRSCGKVAVPWELCPQGGPLSFVHRHPSVDSLGIVIGPEGGISSEEMEVMLKEGCESVTLGKRILRTETAGIAAVSAFLGLYGEME